MMSQLHQIHSEDTIQGNRVDVKIAQQKKSLFETFWKEIWSITYSKLQRIMPQSISIFLEINIRYLLKTLTTTKKKK